VKSVETEKRYGKFSISFDLFLNYFEQIRSLLSGVVVMRAESSYVSACIEYTAWCEEFDLVKEGEEIPIYRLYRKAEEVPEEDRERVGFEFIERLYFIKDGETDSRIFNKREHRVLRIRRNE
jgi:hypothetical protein